MMRRRWTGQALRLGIVVGLALVLGLLVDGAAARAQPAATVQLATTGRAGGFSAPLDAAPSPDGATFYFIASDTAGRPTVYRVPAEGGDPQPLLSGGALAAPRGLVAASDGATLFLADSGAGDGGAILALPAAGGNAVAVAGSVGTRPRALDLLSRDGRDRLIFAGSDPASGAPSLFALEPASGRRATLASDDLLASADGVAMAATGDLFVAAPMIDGVLGVRNGVVTPLAANLRLGSPAGVALTLDGTELLVSSLAEDGSARVVLIVLATGEQVVFNDVIGENRASGGLHRALNAPVFAWADIFGGVYHVGRPPR